MKLSFVGLCGFRGFRKAVHIDFGDQFTIIDGRNGVGKSTVFDAIEFGITGSLSKYSDAKAAGETVEDYLWWKGDGPAPLDRYVEVGFREGDAEIRIRRTQLGETDTGLLRDLESRLCDVRLAPTSPLKQICATAIIRDEHITSLSLDMKEADRYALLRDALGANDSDQWLSRAARLIALAKKRTSAAQQEVTIANLDVTAAALRLDEVRSALVSDVVIAEASQRLQAFVNTVVTLDQLLGPAREHIATVRGNIDTIQSLLTQWSAFEAEQQRSAALSEAVDSAHLEKQEASNKLQGFARAAPDEAQPSSSTAEQARDLIALISLGRKMGLRDDHCPLCAKGQSHKEFAEALASTEALARRLNEQAAQAAELEELRSKAQIRLDVATQTLYAAQAARTASQKVTCDFVERRKALGFAPDATLGQIQAALAQMRHSIELAEKDVRVLETLGLSESLERAQRAEFDAKARVARAQDKYGRARKAEAGSQALHDAARRAASETLDRRLERVLPLMAELYRRLRPHPVWTDIEYSIRGDVRRFMKLQVGNDLNPQFLFSSGQRRATGLAFLLSVNLSLAWSRWRTILLDDPVQHVDDFRAVHLAELLAQLVVDGRQIVCAVEDAALADLLGRRLPVDALGAAKRITLGPDIDGALTKQGERLIVPLPMNTVVVPSGLLSTG